MSGTDIQMDKGSDVEDTTMRLYHGIVDYGELHRLAFLDLSRAVARGDEAMMKSAFDAITYYEQKGREAAIETRKHLLTKAASHG